MNIKNFTCNMLQENCYVVSDETKECVIIDCGAYYDDEQQAIVNYIKDNELVPRHLLVTHGHLDHNFGNDMLNREFGLQPEVSTRDEHIIMNLTMQAQQFYNLSLELNTPTIKHFFEDNELISFGNHKLKVLETPGHTKGSVCFYCAEENVLFSGDTLFRGSIGRTDLGGGSMIQIIQSLRFLAQLPDETIVFSGHGPSTTIGNELAHNPYMDR